MSRVEILQAALALPDAEKALLIEDLLSAFEPESNDLDDAAFAAELQRRSREIDEGTAELIPWSEIKDEPW